MIDAIVAILERFELEVWFLVLQEDCVISKPAEELMLGVVSFAFQVKESSIVDASMDFVNSRCLVIGDYIQAFTHCTYAIHMGQTFVQTGMIILIVGDDGEVLCLIWNHFVIFKPNCGIHVCVFVLAGQRHVLSGENLRVLRLDHFFWEIHSWKGHICKRKQVRIITIF